ncbi:MAG: phosphoribosylanthranilate isomerase [Candidatus Dormibacteraeota bacterium]|nr:phosphoribosylanthranilate isomerase [Candidatus Dormibacteraeota bacterium]MBV9526122.1 phosphoribosylanthranilate isomerase [Candidatus Dormibacteraeota bacterium]
MIVKVCGVTDAEVAEAAVSAGADLIGLVFEPRSPRHADDAQARRVACAVGRGAQLVGVFVEPAAERCMEAAARYGLSAVQVHGDIDARFVMACDVPVIRGYNVRSAEDALTLQWWPDCLLLLDAPAAEGGLPGGTGTRLPRELAAEVARHRRVILAGGIGADDVAEAISAVRPHGVDASSRLETAPGRKDPALVREYVTSARAAFAGLNGG